MNKYDFTYTGYNTIKLLVMYKGKYLNFFFIILYNQLL